MRSQCSYRYLVSDGYAMCNDDYLMSPAEFVVEYEYHAVGFETSNVSVYLKDPDEELVESRSSYPYTS